MKVEDGGTGGLTVPEAQEALRVPGLDTDNVFTGHNTFQVQGLDVESGLHAFSTLTVDDQVQFGAATDPSTPFYCYFFALLRGGISISPPFSIDFTGDRTLALSDTVVRLTSGDATVTIPTGATDGTLFIIKNGGAGTLTLASAGSDTIDGASPGTVAAGAVVRLVFNGGNDWITI